MLLGQLGNHVENNIKVRTRPQPMKWDGFQWIKIYERIVNKYTKFQSHQIKYLQIKLSEN
jgi:hypothetical protein